MTHTKLRNREPSQVYCFVWCRSTDRYIHTTLPKRRRTPDGSMYNIVPVCVYTLDYLLYFLWECATIARTMRSHSSEGVCGTRGLHETGNAGRCTRENRQAEIGRQNDRSINYELCIDAAVYPARYDTRSITVGIRQNGRKIVWSSSIPIECRFSTKTSSRLWIVLKWSSSC